ncbi:Csu type fimbrial protein [Sulfurospirillum sp. 1612]|uniref:Csu type fimbrial protein n=1 Tax=Sulfurospirillum sp. 1612 TaxID=3094835 RepID=UPI002F93DEEE
MLSFNRMLFFASLAVGLLNAASTTTTFTVNATVINTCHISATDLNFGNYDPLSVTPTDGTSTITVTCVLNSAYEVALDKGSGSGSDFTTGRKMTGDTNATELLTYNLYTEASHTTVWGDGTGSSTVSGTGSGPLSSINHTVYGRIPANENVSAQTYQDTITATINY